MNSKWVSFLFAALLVLNLTDIPDKAGDNYFDESLKSATATFVVARGLNGIISVIQDADIAATPAGVGISISPGESLDPLNDLIEKFSTIMLLATASLGIQKILLTISGWWVTKILIFVMIVMLLIVQILNKTGKIKRDRSHVLFKIIILLLSMRFVVPFIAVSSSLFESVFLKASITAKTQNLQIIEQTTSEINQHEPESSWFENVITTGKELGELKDKAKLLKEKLSSSVESIVDLIALFVVQTILFPIAFLYFALKLIKILFRFDFSNHLLDPKPPGRP